MGFLMLVFITILVVSGSALAEPKFRYIDTENKDKKKDETKETKPPVKPAYYDNYKKAKPSPAPNYEGTLGTAPDEKQPQMSREDMNKMMELLSNTKKDLAEPPAEPAKAAPSSDYANPPAAPKK